ncbi:MAG TPA: protein kinase [Candidatus Solibacter sp.]|nr:protein kinase [Candidatus Solibacter sp.]
MALQPGTQLGPYTVVAGIGTGGMGAVYKATDTRLHRTVAIKVSQQQFTDRFDREARAIAALNHPHICQIYDVGPNYLVMEYVEGKPLTGPLPIEKAVEYAGQILDALDAAHQKGIIHRDLKPANILVTRLGIKLLDFGLAKVRHQAPPPENSEVLTKALTTEGQITGTLQYMSPEQLQTKPVDTRSDLFSFGCVLYEMLTGKRAFEGDSTASVIAAVLERAPAPVETAPMLDRVVRRSLAKDPDQRFQTARDLRAALAWAIEHPPSRPAPRRRLQPLTLACAFAAVLAIGAGTFSYLRPPVRQRAFRLQIGPPEGARFLFGNGVGGAALSPDGSSVAFVAAQKGKPVLWIQGLGDSGARQLPGTDRASYPFWSPDGKSIAFFTATQLLRIDATGGSPLVICDVASGRGGAWLQDHRILFAATSGGLFQAPDSGGPPTPFTTLDTSRGETTHRWPQLLPGGRLLYFVRSDTAGNTGMYLSTLSKPMNKAQLVKTQTNALYAPGGDGRSYLLWQRSGTLEAQELDLAGQRFAGEPHPVADQVGAISGTALINVSVSAEGTLLYGATLDVNQFMWVDRAGKSLGPVGNPGAYSTFRLSADGRHIAASREQSGSTDLWLLDAERGAPRRFTSNGSFNVYPVWSPDAQSIMFTSGTLSLFLKPVSSSAVEERLTRSANQFPTDWSRDGKLLLYYEIAPATQRDLWVVAVTRDGHILEAAKPRLFLRTPFNETGGRFAPEPDPRWIAYQSDESGRPEVYLQSFPEPHGAIRISTGGGTHPAWSNAFELFYVSPEHKLMAVSLQPSKAGGAPEATSPRELFALDAVNDGYSPYEAAPDGKRFLLRQPSQTPQPLNVMVNWSTLLK